MAGTVITTAVVTIGGTDLSGYVQSVEISESFDELDTTTMASGGRRERVAGLGDGQATFNFFNEWGGAGPDATIAPLVGTVAAVTVKPASGAVSATNPEYQFSVLVKEWTTGLTVGELSMASVTWSISGAIVKDITP